MAKMTKAQAKKRLLEAKKKIDAVFMSELNFHSKIMNFSEYDQIMKRLNNSHKRIN